MARKKTFKDYTALGSIAARLILQNLPFVLFLSFLGVIYIANAHFSEKTIREIRKLQQEREELRWKYMSLRSEIMYNSKYSEVEQTVREEGLRNPKNELKIIKVKDTDL